MVVQLDGPLGHAQQRIFKVVSELAEGAPLERLWRSGEQEGSKQPAIKGGKELRPASDQLLVEPRQATYSHSPDLHGMQEARGSSPLSSTFTQVNGLLLALK